MTLKIIKESYQNLVVKKIFHKNYGFLSEKTVKTKAVADKGLHIFCLNYYK